MNLSKLIYSWKNAAINSLALLMTGFFLLNTNLATAQLAYVANNTSGDIVVIDLSDGSIVTTIDIQGAPVKIVAAPDGSQIASLAATSVAFVDPATNTIINDVSDANASELRGIVYSDDGATLYTIDQLTTLITPYNTSTQAAGSFGFLTSGVGPLALGFDFLTGNIIAVNNGSADLATFSPALVQQGSNIAVGQAPQDIAILPGTDLAYVSNFNTDNVSVVDLSDGTTSTVPNVEDPLGIVALPNGSTVYVINNTGTVTVIETATNTVVTTITVGSTPRGIAVSPDGSQVIVANAGDNTIAVIDVETNEVVNTFGTGEETGPVGVAVIDQPVSLQPPVASFTATPTSGSAPLSVAFNGNGSTDTDGFITAYAFDFGDGNTAATATATNVYVTPGTYTAQLIVTDNDGLMDTTTQTITVNEPTLEELIANTVDAQTITEVLGLNFGGVSTAVSIAGDPILAQDGNASPVSPLTGTTRFGASDVTQTFLTVLALALQEEEALDLDAAISTFIDVSTLTNINGSVTIRQLLTHTSGIADFASAADYQSTILFDVTRVFTPAEITELFVGSEGTPGTFAYSNTNFLVLGLVLDAANGDETLEESLDRLISTPAGLSNVDFYQTTDPSDLAPLFDDVFGTGFPQQLTPNTSVFTGASTAGNLILTPAQMVAFIRELALGNIITPASFVQLLEFAEITGRESDDYGLGLEQFTLTIDGVELPFIGHAGDINYAGIVLYSCDADIAVSVMSNNGLVSEADVLALATQLIDIAIDGTEVTFNQAPVASAVADVNTGDAPLSVNFDGSGSTDSDGSIVSFAWDFGDGSTSADISASNIFTVEDTTYTVTLIVTDNKGAKDTATVSITTAAPAQAPVADVVATPTSGSAPLTVAFNGNGSTDADGVITDYNWTFGDGNAAVGATNVNTYVEPGTYTAQLIVTDNDGLMDTTTVIITVNEPTLEEVLQNIVDASDITEELGLNFGGISAAVVNNGGQMFTPVSGDASPGTAMSDANLLGASDVTQSILAALTFALMEEEALTLNTTVGELIDVSGLTNVSGAITIGQLLMHTSGLADFASAADYESTILFDVTRVFTPEEITELFVGAAGTPGTFAYSNTNFLVLGLVLEAANGEETLEETLDRLIGTPASVSLDFYVDADPAGLAPLFADVFGTGFPQQLNPNTSVFTGASTAGNIYGTPSDYLAFIKALVDGNIISGENFARLLDFMAITGRESTDYGKGVEQFMLDIDGAMLPFFGHVGDINYGSVLLYSCDANSGVSLVTNNATATEAEIIELARQLLDAVIDGGSVVLNQAPTASFTADPTEGEAPLTVNVDAAASSDADGSIVRYEWDFGDGNTATGVTASNEYMSSGSFTITLTVRDNKGAVGTATETITVGEAPEAFSLQILHASDLEGGLDALANAPNFAAIIDALEEENENTLILSAGDNYIPGPFFNAAGNSGIRPTIQSVYQDLFNEPGLTNYREGSGRVDISIMNIIGFDASAVGNHEFDAGPNAFAGLIETDIRGPELSDVRWLGAQFPYLSANLDFSSDDDLNGLFTSDILDNNAFQSLPDDLTAAAAAPKLAQATTIQRGGETIGVIGATTQILEQITSTGEVMVVGPTEDDMPALAEIIQPLIDGFEEDGVNKIILVTHLQQIALEKALAQLLSGVDVIIAGGSDVLQAQPDDVLRPGDTADEGYPFVTTNLDNDPALVVGTDGEYSYVGRLIIEFDENGVIVPGSFDNELNGAYPSIASVVDDVAGPGAFDPNTKGELVERLIGALQDVINETDGVILGQTSVFIEGRREAVRTEETNLGNLTADANLVLAKSFDQSVEISLKNGGGIRAAIGQIIDNGDGTVTLGPPPANPSAGKEEGDISQLDVENSLRFNNGLTLLTLTIPQLQEVLEHAFGQTEPGATPGRFPQVAGIQVFVDVEQEPGSRVTDLFIVDEMGNTVEQLIANGSIIADPERTVRIVTLDFLANDGDGYPYPDFAATSDRLDLETAPSEDGDATFAPSGTEQDALAEYLLDNFASPDNPPFDIEDTPIADDMRIIFGAPSQQAPVAAFVATPTSGAAPLEVAFNGTSSTDADGVITDYLWNFGDGNTAVGATAMNTYLEPGTYVAELVVIDNDGLTNTTTQTITVNEPTLAEELQNIVDASDITEELGLNFGGISAAVINNGGELFTPVSGDARPGFAMDNDDRLGASDVTQTLLTALTLALMDEGALALNQQIDEFVDAEGLTNVPGTILINQLLTHTSGLADFSLDPDYTSTVLFDVERFFTPEEILNEFQGAAGTPGTFAYSNTNFLVLGLVLEAANGEETLQESLNRLIATPAGLTGLDFYVESDPADLAPLFADVFGTGFPQQLDPNTSVFTGASTTGNLLATPTTFLNFIKALAEGNILAPATFVKMLELAPITGRLSTDYGKGLEEFTLDIDGVMLPFIGHIGDINYGSVLLYSCDAESGVSLITNNATATEAEILELARQLLDAVIDGEAVVENQAPEANIVADPVVSVAPSTVAFDGSGSFDSDGTIVAYAWDFGDGNTSTEIAPSNTYNEPGEYAVSLTVTDNKGLTGTATATIIVNEPGGEGVDVELSLSASPASLTLFTNVVLTFEVSNTGSETASGIMVSAPVPTGFAFTSADVSQGEYSLFFERFEVGTLAPGETATLELSLFVLSTEDIIYYSQVIDQDQADVDSAPNNNAGPTPVEDDEAAVAFGDVVVEQAPVALFVATPSLGDAPLDVAFDASASFDPDGTIEDYAWGFGDGNTGSGITASNTYVEPGTYTATLTVTDNDGLTGTTTRQIVVEDPNAAPDLELSVSASNTVLEEFANIDIAITVTNAGDATATGVEVDGSLPAGLSFVSADPSQGIYNDFDDDFEVGTLEPGESAILIITAFVTDINTPVFYTQVLAQDQGDLDSAPNNNAGPDPVEDDEAAVEFTPDPDDNEDPVASFLADPETGFASLTVNFNASNSSDIDGTIVDYAWDFGDGNSGSGITPSNTYTAPGVYEVTLTVTDDDGATGTAMASITVLQDGEGMDLELNISADPAALTQFTTTTITFEVTNTGSETANGVRVFAPVPEGFAFTGSNPIDGSYSLFFETWSIDAIAPGETAVLELVIFVLFPDSPFTYYSQITNANPTDVDSTPNNNPGPDPVEDDEAAIVLTLPIGLQSNGLNLSQEADLSGEADIKVFPNPAQDEIFVDISAFVGQNITYQVMNVNGKVVAQLDLGKVEDTRLRLNTTDFAPGVYMLNMKIGEDFYGKAFMIARQ